MRGALILFAALLASGPAMAFKDAKTTQALSVFKADVAVAKDGAQKLAALEKLRDALADHLRTVPLPKTKRQKAAFADLNEFQAAVFTIRMDTIDSKSCAENRESLSRLRVSAPGGDEAKAPTTPALQEALSVLLLLCR